MQDTHTHRHTQSVLVASLSSSLLLSYIVPCHHTNMHAMGTNTHTHTPTHHSGACRTEQQTQRERERGMFACGAVVVIRRWMGGGSGRSPPIEAMWDRVASSTHASVPRLLGHMVGVVVTAVVCMSWWYGMYVVVYACVAVGSWCVCTCVCLCLSFFCMCVCMCACVCTCVCACRECSRTVDHDLVLMC